MADDRNVLEERWADLKDVRLRYYVGGSGPPLVLVHGLGGAASNWIGMMPLLAERFRLLVPDLPGHGASGPLPAAGTVDPYAARIIELAEREEMLPAAVVGHSFGGLISLRMTLRRPEAVSALILVASVGIGTTSRRVERLLALSGFLRPARFYSHHRKRIIHSKWLRYPVFGYWGASDPLALPPEIAEGFLDGPRLHTDIASAIYVLVRDDPRLDLEGVRCPSLVLWGANDHQVGYEVAFEYGRRLRAPVRLIADSGHLVVGERPDACADAIESFLAPTG